MLNNNVGAPDNRAIGSYERCVVNQNKMFRRSKCGKPNDELPVEGSRKDTVLQCEFVDEYKVMDMKQTSNCSGFNVTFRPSAFGLLQTWDSTYLQVKRLKRCKD